MWLWPATGGLIRKQAEELPRGTNGARAIAFDGKISRSMPSLGTVYTCCVATLLIPGSLLGRDVQDRVRHASCAVQELSDAP